MLNPGLLVSHLCCTAVLVGGFSGSLGCATGEDNMLRSLPEVCDSLGCGAGSGILSCISVTSDSKDQRAPKNPPNYPPAQNQYMQETFLGN